MAVTTEIEQRPSLVPPVNGEEKPQRPRGRPKKCRECGDNIDPTVPHVCGSIDLPPDDEPVQGKEDFWSELASIQDWTNRFAYLFRLGPTIDRRSGGRQINIEKFARPFDIDDIMRKHGSGVYRLDLFRIDERTGRYVRYRQERFDIVNMDYPPNVPPGDWANEPENAVWQWAIPKIQAAQQNGGGMYPPGFDMDKVYDRAFKMAQQSIPPAPPPKDDTVVTTLLNKLLDASLKPPPEPPKLDTKPYELIIEALREDRKEMRAEIAEMRKNAAIATVPVPQKTLMEQIKEIQPAVLGFMELVGDRTAKPDLWQTLLQPIAEGIGEVLPIGVEMLKNAQQQPRPQQQPQAIQPRLPNPQQQAAATPPNAANVAPIEVQPQPQQPEPAVELTDEQKEQQRAETLVRKWSGFILHIMPQMIEHFRAIGDSNGLDFRDWVLRKKGEDPWGDMRREIGPAMLASMICELVANNPQDQNLQQLQPPGAVAQFCEEFFTIPEQEDEDDEEGGEPIAAA